MATFIQRSTKIHFTDHNDQLEKLSDLMCRVSKLISVTPCTPLYTTTAYCMEVRYEEQIFREKDF